MARVRGLIFDLDGVLVDSLPSITECFNYALARSGLAEITTEEVRPLLGPPLEETVAWLLKTEDAGEIARFVAVYRERYAEICTRETPGMPGLHAVLAALAERWPLAVATNKAEAFARPILAALGVAGFFVMGGICGRSLELGGGSKAAVIGRVVPLLGGAEGLIMIGDRSHDVVGAQAHGIPTIGVLHGSGSREELVAAGARWIAADLRALPGLVGRIDAGEG
jgi:phosphoglycolate phosphatase